MSRHDILGMNERNLSFVRAYNKKKATRLADEKLLTKELLIQIRIPTPKLYGVIKTIKDFENFDWKKLPANFVIKPNRGFGGEGIVLLRRSKKKEEFLKLPLKKREWITSSGNIWDFEKLKSHILDILDGSFSLQGLPDTAFIERKLTTHPIFLDYTKKGIPDIRVIVFNNVPVMSMMRLPTEKSQGRANIAQGAIAVGIDIGSGVTTTAMTKLPTRKIIDSHPDTNQKLSDFKIPNWDKILEMSVEAQVVSGIGYLGVDIAIDRRNGPEILELNARPGLDIQVANLEGLAGRLKRVKGLKVKSVTHGIRIAKDLFGGDVERRVEEVSNREVIGTIEDISLYNKSRNSKIEIKAKVDTGAGMTSVDRDLAIKLGFGDAIKHYESFNIKEILTKEEVDELSRKKTWKKLKEHKDIVGVTKVFSSHGATYRIMVAAVFYLAGRKILSQLSIVTRKALEYPMIVGRRDLKDFLVDPTKNVPKKDKKL